MIDVLLDTTFLLPTLGVKVKEITERDFQILKELLSKSSARLYCSHLSFVEILGKFAREYTNLDADVFHQGIRSLVESGTYYWVNPSAEALQRALMLRVKGNRDNVDNILYSIALTSGMLFLSLDAELKNFLVKNRLDAKMVVGTKELEEVCRRR